MSLGFSPAVSHGSFGTSQSPLSGPPSSQSGRPSLGELPRGPPIVPGPWHYSHPMAAAAALMGQSAPGIPDGVGQNMSPGGVPPSLLPITGGSSIMENWENWRQFQQAAYANNLDPHMLAFYHNAGCAMDLSNAPRRKNATRETTSMLKAWLNEHRKNPYPTKGEKIMLAIITKMTLTQVSTWFANARRRLKKENKMTWSPRNRSEEERERGRQQASSLSGGGGNLEGGDDPRENRDSEEEYDDLIDDDITGIGADNQDDDLDDFDEEDRETLRRLQSSAGFFNTSGQAHLSFGKEDKSTVKDCNNSEPTKPKIWSLVDTATKEKSTDYKQCSKPPVTSMEQRNSSRTSSSQLNRGLHNTGSHFMMSHSSHGPTPHFTMANLLQHPSHNQGVHMFGKLFPPPPPSSSINPHHLHHPFVPGQVGNPPEAAVMAAYLHNPFMYPGLSGSLSALVNRPPVSPMANMAPADIAAAMAAAVAASRDPPILSPEVFQFGMKDCIGPQGHTVRPPSPAISSTSSSPSK